jgi:hypothetical protein
MFFSRQEGPAEPRLLHSGLKRVMTCLPDFAWGLDRPIGHVRGMSACPSKATIARNTLTRRSVPTGDIIRVRRGEPPVPASQGRACFFDVDRQLVFWSGVCAMPPYSIHCSQGLHDREIAHPNEANARIVQVDSHPQCDRKNDSVNVGLLRCHP